MDDWLEDLCQQPGPPTMEFTLKIGCKLNCDWCPQDKLVAAYRNPKRAITLQDFRQVLSKLPPEVEVHFSGMSEPLFHKDWMFMVAMAHQRKRKVRVFTTLWGASLSAVDYLCSSPLEELAIHLPSAGTKERLELTDEHYHRIKRVLETRVEADCLIFNCDGSVPEKLMRILDRNPECYRVNRAGNLPEGPELNHKGPIECARDGRALRKNVVLPDGRVLLCCMDYSMQHVLGNVITEPYSFLEHRRNEIREKLDSETSTTLCRHCHLAVPAGSVPR